MASNVELSIPTTSTSATAKPYTIYHISVRQPLRSFTVEKRYSDFTTLHTDITAQCGNIAPPTSLPAKNWFKSTISSPELTENRRQGLETYLRSINSSPDARWRSCSAWRKFLNLPNPNSTGARPASGTTSTKSGDLTAAILDPAVWLDVHRDLKTQLRDARQHLNRREQAVSVQAQHEATGDAKRCLVRSGTFISALEKGLVAMAAKSEGEKDADGVARLGEGEVRRRRDLVLGAKKERDALEALLAAIPSRTGRSRDNTPTPTSEKGHNATGASYFPQQPTSNPSTSRRVLGAPVKETEQTRELDNNGVLQLQRQIMQDQDQDAEELSKVVHRIRNMGEQMNEELVLQGQMLGMLEEDTERVDKKIEVSKKRLGKIS